MRGIVLKNDARVTKLEIDGNKYVIVFTAVTTKTGGGGEEPDLRP